MTEILQNKLKLGGIISEINSDSFIYELKLNKENIQLINELQEGNIRRF